MLSSLDPGPDSKCSKPVEVRCSCSELKPWRNPRKKIIIDSAAIWKVHVSVHWRAQCHAKWPRGCRAPCENQTWAAQHPATRLNQPWVLVSLEKKTVYYLKCFATRGDLQQLFACRIVVLRLLRLNIKARHEISEFLNANLWSIRLIAFNIDWSWNIFTSHNFCLLLIEQLIDLEKIRT